MVLGAFDREYRERIPETISLGKHPHPDMIAYVLIAAVSVTALSLVLSTLLTGVPSISSRRSERADVIALAHQAITMHAPVIYDLGCGWGAMLVDCANAFPNARIVGVELSPLPYMISCLRTHAYKNVSILFGNFYKADIRHADVVICYLMPQVMPRVQTFLDTQLEDDTIVISNTFQFRSQTRRSFPVTNSRRTALLYRWAKSDEHA
jgi:hypothetical protein